MQNNKKVTSSCTFGNRHISLLPVFIVPYYNVASHLPSVRYSHLLPHLNSSFPSHVYLLYPQNNSLGIYLQAKASYLLYTSSCITSAKMLHQDPPAKIKNTPAVTTHSNYQSCRGISLVFLPNSDKGEQIPKSSQGDTRDIVKGKTALQQQG